MHLRINGYQGLYKAQKNAGVLDGIRPPMRSVHSLKASIRAMDIHHLMLTHPNFCVGAAVNFRNFRLEWSKGE